MKVTRLCMKNFRGIKSAALDFEGHTLFAGTNNVGKSTIFEALDLVLGPDRISKFPSVQEFDFYNAIYLEADGKTPLPIQIEVILINLTEEVMRTCAPHVEFWHTGERRILDKGEIEQVDQAVVKTCLRLETHASYDPEEDEFEADTFFTHSPNEADGSLKSVGKRIKRLFGFLYLRALRTGSRALTLERGSLLDRILQLQGIRTGLWKQSIKRLRDLDPPIDHDAVDLLPVLDSIEKRLAQYIPTQGKGRATRLFVSQLTREHLRETMSFFLSMSPDQEPVPFEEVGTGTLSALVLALLSFIAEIKKDNVIFAMEEPEIALPPHTQRRIANYLLEKTTQCFVTSHSPYVIERFDPDQILILRRSADAVLTATPVSSGTTLKEKTYRRYTRRGLAEAMLGRGVIVAEGITEQSALSAVAEKLEATDKNLYPLDLAGVTILPVDGDGSMPAFGAFFRSLDLKAYAFYDNKKLKPADAQKFKDSFDLPYQTKYAGMETLLTNETPAARQWQLLAELRAQGEQGNINIPEAKPGDEEVKKLARTVLEGNKGSGYAARLIDLCDLAELPISITEFLKVVYKDFPPPTPAPKPPTPAKPASDQAAAPNPAVAAAPEPKKVPPS